ncbi:MAG TPA: phosphatase PAP2 family protein [Chthoniobacterales bacterium]
MKTETENASRWVGWIILIGLLIVAIGLALLVDKSVATWINGHSSRALRRFMYAVSRVGDWPGHVLAGSVMIAVAWLSGSKSWTRIFLAMLIACALAGIVARVGKIAIGRPRPSTRIEQTWNGPSLHSKFNAFPSGHTAASTAFFVTLLIATGWRIGIPLLVVPLLIAASRMIVAAHYLSDVVGGFAVGIIAALLVADWLRIRSPRSRIDLSACGIQETGKS